MAGIERPRRGAVAPSSLLFSLALLFSLLPGLAHGAVKAFASYERFLGETQRARYEDYAKREGTKVRSAAEFEKMKAHVVSMYQGVRVKNSFVLDDVDHVDCIDINTQPGLRQPDGKFRPLAKPPAPAIAREKQEDPSRAGQAVAPMLGREKKDAFGNAQFCENGFIPMRRVTLDELVRYETLADFFNKYGKAGEKGMPEREPK